MAKTTLQTYKAYKRGRVALEIGKYAITLVPTIVSTAVNWQNWFQECGASLPFGFVSLLLGIVLAILGISKKDNFIKEKVSNLLYLAVTFACFGVAFMFLGNVMNQMGYVFLWSALAICCSFAMDQINKTVIEEKIKFYQELVEKNHLDPKENIKIARREALIKKAKEEAKNLQATE